MVVASVESTSSFWRSSAAPEWRRDSMASHTSASARRWRSSGTTSSIAAMAASGSGRLRSMRATRAIICSSASSIANSISSSWVRK